MTDPNDNSGLTAATQSVAESLKTLRQLGQNDVAQQILDAAHVTYDTIVDDTSRSQSWKIQTAAARYIAVMTSLSAKLRAAARSASTTISDDKNRVYGIVGLKGDYGSLQIAHRDAVMRVNDMDIFDHATRRQLLASAVDHGDETLAHAVVEAAVRVGDADTVNGFEAAFPTLAAATERLWEFANARPRTADVVTAMQSFTLKPDVLTGLQDHEIESAAAGNTSAGRWNVGLS